jgi:small subunit ribosomal protein S1
MTNDSGSDFQSLLDNEEHAPAVTRGMTLSGRVAALDAQGAMIDLGLKRDAIVPRAEVDKLAQQGVKIEVGQTIGVVVMNPEDRDGNIVISIDNSRQQQAWLTAEKLLESSGIWEGKVTGYNRGGLLVQFGEVQAFVPASQVVDLPHQLPETERPGRLATFVGRTLGFKVVEVDRRRKRLVLSERKAYREYRKKQQGNLFETLAEGQVRQGVVTALRDFGAFVDLGGGDGLIHISEISWQRVKHPSEVLTVGQAVEVEVLKVDPGAKKIALSLKRRQADPWTKVIELFTVGQVCEGTVTRVVAFGAFVDLGHGIEGLLHTSRWGGQTLAEGDQLKVKVLRIEPERQRVSLGLEAKLAAPPVEHKEVAPVEPEPVNPTGDSEGQEEA